MPAAPQRRPGGYWLPTWRGTAPAPLDKKWAALAALVILQTTGSLVYRVSQTSSRYAFSTFAALAVAEAFKLAIIVAFYLRNPVHDSHLGLTLEHCKPRRHWLHSLEILALAAAYCANNQLMFYIFLRADMASVVMFKSTSSFVVALLRSALMREWLTGNQWRAIVAQICGLVVTQYNVCDASTTLAHTTYAMLATSVFISAFTSVWNERQLKRAPLSMHAQNMIMYSGGCVFNVIGHYATALSDATSPGFFHGYNAATVGVVLVNACTGVAITAVYKFADAVMKSLALSLVTVVVTLLSWALFGLQLNPVNASGCIVVALSVYTYSVAGATK